MPEKSDKQKPFNKIKELSSNSSPNTIANPYSLDLTIRDSMLEDLDQGIQDLSLTNRHSLSPTRFMPYCT
ncbi:hypothetical protein BY458DRAFT_510753 [Sporodiniella umbellata]|nr:hypothetical protein BY458DRAFT_510753 [Sporodiniella umbellata]